MSRQLCGICMCPYDEEDGSCGCTEANQECASIEMNKPVAYWDGKHFASKDKSSLADIPLYTHPVKEQSNLVNVVKDHIEDLWRCVKTFRSYEMDNTADEMEVAIKELEDAIEAHPVKEQKCIVKDCENHKHEGGFVGDLCKPCHQFITTGEGIYSQAYRNSNPVKELTDEEILEVWRENERVYPMDRSRLLDRTRACIKKASEK